MGASFSIPSPDRHTATRRNTRVIRSSRVPCFQYPLTGSSHCNDDVGVRRADELDGIAFSIPSPDRHTATAVRRALAGRGYSNFQYPLTGSSHCNSLRLSQTTLDSVSFQYPLTGSSHCNLPCETRVRQGFGHLSVSPHRIVTLQPCRCAKAPKGTT